MKILFYIHSFYVGGAETIVCKYALNLKERNHNVIIVVNERSTSFLEKRLIDSGIEIISLHKRNSRGIIGRASRKILDLFIGFKWNSIYKSINPDIVHIHTSPQLFRQQSFPANRIVYTFHSEVERAVTILGRDNKKRIIQLANKGMTFIAINKKMVDDIRRLFTTDKVVYIPNGIDLKETESKKKPKEWLCSILNIPFNSFIVGHVGRIHSVKNHERIMSLFVLLAKKREDAHLVLVGEDVDNRKDMILQVAKENGVEDRVHFMGVREDATSILSCFDVLLLPSFSESFSIVLIEAQIFRVKSVVSEAINKELIFQDNCHRLSLSADNQSWVEAILDNSISKGDICPFSFDIDIVIEQTTELYKNMLIINNSNNN